MDKQQRQHHQFGTGTERGRRGEFEGVTEGGGTFIQASLKRNGTGEAKRQQELSIVAVVQTPLLECST